MSKKIPVVELFGPTIQGEGAVAGQVSFFVRTGGCPLRCSWCDSPHAVQPKEIKKYRSMMTPEEIVDDVVQLAAGPVRRSVWVTLTGGDPVMWDMTGVVQGLRINGFRIAVETQGTLWQEWLEYCDLVTCSPKPPSSGMADKLDVALLQKYWVRCNGRMVFKIVVFDDADLEFAARIHRALPVVKLYLSAGTPQSVYVVEANRKLDVCAAFRQLCEKVTQNPNFHDAVVGMQMHTLAWGRDLGR